MATCYFSGPFGRQQGSLGATIDFDQLYRDAIKPAVEEAGLDCVRADEFPMGGILHRSILSAVLASDVMVADISTDSANVFYELGVRHIAQRAGTILLKEQQSRIPFDLSYVHVLQYEVDEAGIIPVERLQQFRQRLSYVIRQSRELLVTDSPVYDLIPGLSVELPPELAAQARRFYPSKLRSTTIWRDESDDGDVVGEVANELRSSTVADPYAYIDLLRRARDQSNWDQLIALAEDAPSDVRSAPETRQLLALALNRQGERLKAIAEMQALISETGGNAESFGVLGKIYKDQYVEDGESIWLHRAIGAYRDAFQSDPNDIYAGSNLLMLLLQQSDPQALADLAEALPVVRWAIDRRMADQHADIWTVEAHIEVAAIAGDWEAARRSGERLVQLSTADQGCAEVAAASL